MQRKFEAGDVADRFVLPPAETATNASKPRRKPHHNAALVRGLRDNELRACYRATFKEDPGQMGKDKMLRPVRLAEDGDARTHRRRTRRESRTCGTCGTRRGHPARRARRLARIE